MEAEKPAAADSRTDSRPGWRRRPLMLVGMPGSGKTSVGKRLAGRLGWPFVDVDVAIEAAAGLSIPEIFKRDGEAHFRQSERRIIARLLDDGPQVIATGGGAFSDEATRALSLKKATVVWLDASIPTLVARVSRRNHRPLLVGRDPTVVLTELATVRNPHYSQAHYRVESGEVPHDATVEQILARLREGKA
ncbi:MAG: shikimate kinase [Sphingomonadaceae bacterium]